MPPTLAPGTEAPSSLLPRPLLRRLCFLLDPSGEAGGALVVLRGLRGGGSVVHLCHRLLARCVVRILDMAAGEISDVRVTHGWNGSTAREGFGLSERLAGMDRRSELGVEMAGKVCDAN